MIKGYKIRLYPTKEQEILLNKHIDCCRFIWNFMINRQQLLHKENKKHMSSNDMCKLITSIKKDDKYKWLNDVANCSLQSVCRDLGSTYSLFFNKKCSYPKFKSKKKSKRTFPLRSDKTYFRNEKYITIPKIKELKYKTDFTFKYGLNGTKLLNPRISNINNKWFISFSVEYDNQVSIDNKNGSLGIDLGVKELAITYHNGEIKKFHNINKSYKMKMLENKLKHYQRVAARKYRNSDKKVSTSNNLLKVYDKINKTYQKMNNIRTNYIHQVTNEIILCNANRVVMEDLALSNMIKNKHLSKALKGQRLYDFINRYIDGIESYEKILIPKHKELLISYKTTALPLDEAKELVEAMIAKTEERVNEKVEEWKALPVNKEVEELFTRVQRMLIKESLMAYLGCKPK